MTEPHGVREEQPIMGELATLVASLREKQQRTATLRREYEDALKDNIKASSHVLNLLDQRAAADCHRLTECMYRKLPAELRQSVYRFLCIEDQPIPVGPYYHFRPYRQAQNLSSADRLASSLSVGRIRIDHTKRPDPNILMPDGHIFNRSYVMDKIACEMREAYFRNNTFSICNVDSGIFDFKTLGMIENVRVSWLANKLQIRLKYEHMNDAITKDVVVTRFPGRESFANECSFLRNSKNSLSALHYMQAYNKKLQIEFIIVTALDLLVDKHRCFINILQSLRNTVYALKYGSEDGIIKVVHHDEGVSPFPRNITALWSLTKEQWEHEKNENKSAGRSTWDADFYIAPAALNDSVDEAHGGVPEDEMADLLLERWGIKDALKDTRPKWPVKDGKYWPVGKGTPGWW